MWHPSQFLETGLTVTVSVECRRHRIAIGLFLKFVSPLNAFLFQLFHRHELPNPFPAPALQYIMEPDFPRLFLTDNPGKIAGTKPTVKANFGTGLTKIALSAAMVRSDEGYVPTNRIPSHQRNHDFGH